MTRARRSFALILSSIAVWFAMNHPVWAQTVSFPKTMTIIVPFAPGASNDTFARVLAQQLGPKLGVTMIVDNKPGAGGSIGAGYVARAKPDGSTLLLTSSTFTGNAAVQKKLPYDPIKAFTPVAMLASGPMVVAVGSNTPYKSVAELLAAARAKKGEITYGSAGIGSINQMASELLNSMARVEMTHVPYKGISNAITDMIGGQLQMVIASFPSIAEQAKAGKVRSLAVTSAKRSKFAPELATVADTVPGYNVELWWGIFAPAGMPQSMVERLNAEIRKIIATPEMQKRFAQEGADPSTSMTAGEFAAYVRADIEKWRKVASERNITAD